ncbi:MAG: hypothetical protein AAB263_03545, partial [Planctomycetota bacterium]
MHDFIQQMPISGGACSLAKLRHRPNPSFDRGHRSCWNGGLLAVEIPQGIAPILSCRKMGDAGMTDKWAKGIEVFDAVYGK